MFEYDFLLFGALGLLGILIFFIMLIIKAVKRKPKKVSVIGMMISVLLFAIAVKLGSQPVDITTPSEYRLGCHPWFN